MQLEVEIKCSECGSEDITAAPLADETERWQMKCGGCGNAWISGVYMLTPATKTRLQEYLNHARTSPTGMVLVECNWMSIFCKALGAK